MFFLWKNSDDCSHESNTELGYGITKTIRKFRLERVASDDVDGSLVLAGYLVAVLYGFGCGFLAAKIF